MHNKERNSNFIIRLNLCNKPKLNGKCEKSLKIIKMK